MKQLINSILLTALLLGVISSCEQAYSPKPKGYFRIDFPEKTYVAFDTAFPYEFQVPTYVKITNDPMSPEEKYWINLNFVSLNATLHISYKEVGTHLIDYLEDAHMLVTKHIPMAEAINDSLIIDRDRQVFGLTYRIEGSAAASPYQFFLTDSISHFIRGALYFNTQPNNDSLQPVIDFIIEDIDHMIQTLRWKTNPSN